VESVPAVAHARLPVPERRHRILDAAEACFARNGFHRTTMNDVAAEAGMSAGNLYRYFANKEAIVTGLTERDREMIAADFESIAREPDFFDAFAALGRKHLIDEPKEKTILVMEIWSEAARNAQIAELCTGLDRAVREDLLRMLETARTQGAVHPATDIPAAASMILTLADGLMKRRALEADFDGEHELATVVAVFRLILTSGFAGATSSPKGA
jgi:TetR/AcrR family transcriptional regulator, repressor for uid operon